MVYGPGAVPLAGVAVHAGAAAATSDTNGQFNLALGKVTTAVVILEKTGFSPAYRLVEPKGGSVVTVSAVLAPAAIAGMVTPQSGGTVTVGAGVTITFPPGALVTAERSSPNAPAQIVATWLPPAEAVGQAPFLLQAYDGAVLTPLVSYGMVELIATALGQALQLKSGTTAQ